MSANTSHIIQLILTSGLGIILAIYGLFFSNGRPVWTGYAISFAILLLTVIAVLIWNKINFGAEMMADFIPMVIAIAVGCLFYLTILIFAIQQKKYEYLTAPIGLILIIASLYAYKKYESYAEINSQKFKQRMPDYVSALNSGNIQSIDQMIEKYKDYKISGVYIVDEVLNPETFLYLVQKDILDSPLYYDDYIESFYGKNMTIDRQVFKSFIEKSQESEYNMTYLLEEYRKNLRNLSSEDVHFFIEQISSQYSSLSNSKKIFSGFASNCIYSLSGLTNDIQNSNNTIELINHYFYLIQFYWNQKEVFLTEDVQEKFKFEINRMEISLQENLTAFDLNESTKNRNSYFQKKVAEFRKVLK